MTENITYRGATASRKELAARVDQLQQRQGARHIQYRGQHADAVLNQPHQARTVRIQYRGATGTVEL